MGWLMRKAQQMTQLQLVGILGVNQGEVSKIEHRSDVCVSTLAEYVEALGGRSVPCSQIERYASRSSRNWQANSAATTGQASKTCGYRNLAVLSHDRTLKDTDRCDQQLIGWIATERLWQLGGFHFRSADGDAEATRLVPQERFLSRARRLGRASAYRTPRVWRLLTRDDADPEDAVRTTFKKVTVLRLQRVSSRITAVASQPWLATGSKGSWYSRTESRRLWPPAAFDSAVFGTTNTSTGWPASNGKPFKTSSPCSPTVVSLQCACTPPV